MLRVVIALGTIEPEACSPLFEASDSNLISLAAVMKEFERHNAKETALASVLEIKTNMYCRGWKGGPHLPDLVTMMKR